MEKPGRWFPAGRAGRPSRGLKTGRGLGCWEWDEAGIRAGILKKTCGPQDATYTAPSTLPALRAHTHRDNTHRGYVLWTTIHKLKNQQC